MFTPKRILTICLMAVFLLSVSGLALAKDKNEKRGYLGVMLQDIDSEMAEALELDSKNGILVSNVIADGPAEKAGLEDGDVIIKFQGESLDDYKDLTTALKRTAPGQEVSLVVLRDGKRKSLNVELGEKEENVMVFMTDDGDVHFPNDWHHGSDEANIWYDDDSNVKVMIKGLNDFHEQRGFMGVELDDLNEQMGEFFGVDDGEGALITKVVEDSAAEDAGLRAGDVIIMMDDEDIESSADVHSALAGTKPEETLTVEVIRKGSSKSMELTLGELAEDQVFKHIEVMGGDHDVYFNSPKMWHRNLSKSTPRVEREVIIRNGAQEDLDEMKAELKKMKKELEKMKKEIEK